MLDLDLNGKVQEYHNDDNILHFSYFKDCTLHHALFILNTTGFITGGTCSSAFHFITRVSVIPFHNFGPIGVRGPSDFGGWGTDLIT